MEEPGPMVLGMKPVQMEQTDRGALFGQEQSQLTPIRCSMWRSVKVALLENLVG